MPVWAFITILTALTSLSSAANNLFIPSMPSMTRALGTEAAVAQITLSAFAIGFAIAQLAWGPISDRYGRRPVLVAGLGLYVAASVACWRAGTIEELIFFRMFQALGVCCAPVVSRAIVRDVYELSDAARILSYVSAAFALTPVVAPAIGAAIEEGLGWRANFLFMVATGALMLIAVLAFLPETAQRSRTRLGAAMIVSGYASVLSSRTFLGYSFTVMLCFAAIFVFNSVAPFFFIETSGVGPMGFAVPYALIAVTYGATAYLAARVTHRLGIDRTILIGAWVCLAGAAALAALILVGVTDVWVLCGAMSLFTLGSGFLFPNCQAGAVAPFRERAGAASAMGGFLQMSVAAASGAAVMAAYDGSAIPMGLSVIGFTFLMIAMFWALILHRRPRVAAGADP